MNNDINERVSNEMIRFIIFLAKHGIAFYDFNDGCFYIGNMEFRFDEDFDAILSCVRNHYRTRKNLYKVTYLDNYDGGIAVGYQKAKELTEEIKTAVLGKEEYTKEQRKFDLLNAKETLGVMKWANSSDNTIRKQKEWIQQLEEELKNFDKNLELSLKEYTKIEKINK